MRKISRLLRLELWLHYGIAICISFTIITGSSSSSSSAVAAASDPSSLLLRGVPPQDENYYMELLSSSSSSASATFLKCKDGSKKFSKFQLNDDFCDCPDASDEPGTSACPNGKFYCRNAGHMSLSLYSSRVNDGICDCCDGSDEYDGQVKCSNTCWEAGQVARDKLTQKVSTYQEGVTIRKQEVEKAKIAIAKEEAELAKLKNEEKILKGLVEQLKERKEQIEKAEEKERLQKEKEEKAKKEAEEAKLKETQTSEEAKTSEEDALKADMQDKIGLSEDSPSSQDVVEANDNPESELLHGHDNPESEPLHGHSTVEEESPNGNVELMDEENLQESAEKNDEFTVEDKPNADARDHVEKEIGNTESLSKEELGRLVASRWTGEKTELESEEVGTSLDENHEKQEDDSYEEEYNSYDSEDDEHKYDHEDGDNEEHMNDFGVEDHDGSSFSDKSETDDDFDLSDDMISTAKSSWLEKIQKTVRSILQAVNLFQTPVDKSEAARIRKEYEESNAKLSKLQSKISSLSQKLKHDFGPDKEFYSFYGQCFESKQNKYVYKLCPYKQASQVEGHSTTRLGTWEKFEDSYRVMQFLNGDKCWNGPDRSMKVKLRCGLKNEITDVDEPSRCEYLVLLSTSALCEEEKLKELQDKLDMMSKEQPTGHDEL